MNQVKIKQNSANDKDCKMIAMWFCFESVIVFEEHQSHHMLHCFLSLVGGGFNFFIMLAIGEFIFAMKQFVITQRFVVLPLKFVAQSA